MLLLSQRPANPPNAAAARISQPPLPNRFPQSMPVCGEGNEVGRIQRQPIAPSQPLAAARSDAEGLERHEEYLRAVGYAI